MHPWREKQKERETDTDDVQLNKLIKHKHKLCSREHENLSCLTLHAPSTCQVKKSPLHRQTDRSLLLKDKNPQHQSEGDEIRGHPNQAVLVWTLKQKQWCDRADTRWHCDTKKSFHPSLFYRTALFLYLKSCPSFYRNSLFISDAFHEIRRIIKCVTLFNKSLIFNRKWGNGHL